MSTYKEWVREEAKKIGSDGCTVVSDIYVDACFEHDLGYHYRKDPIVAFTLGWDEAPPISRSEVDARFRREIQAESKLGKWSPVAVIRWLGVRVGGKFIWNH